MNMSNDTQSRMDDQINEAVAQERLLCAVDVCDWCRLANQQQPVGEEHVGAAELLSLHYGWVHRVWGTDLTGKPFALNHVQPCKAGGIWARVHPDIWHDHILPGFDDMPF